MINGTCQIKQKRAGNDLLSHRVPPAVPSALEGLTSVFGMGTGVAPPVWSPAHKLQILLLKHPRPQPPPMKFNGQDARPISTARLNASLRLHLRPIKVVVSDWPSGALRLGNPYLGAGFPLRCFQRLSVPNMATLLCRWRDNRCTRGSSTPVLSY